MNQSPGNKNSNAENAQNESQQQQQNESGGQRGGDKEGKRPADIAIPATRSASFCSTRPSTNVSPPPPTPPTRNSSKPTTTVVAPTTISPGSPEYASVLNEEMPEYAVVQKHHNNANNNVAQKNHQETPPKLDNSIPEYSVVQKNVLKKAKSVDASKVTSKSDFNQSSSKPVHGTPYRVLPSGASVTTSSLNQSVSMDNIGSSCNNHYAEKPEYTNFPASPNKTPPKTSEWRNEWLAKNDEILKTASSMFNLDTNPLGKNDDVVRPDPRPDWARPSADVVVVGNKRSKSPEATSLRPPSRTDSVASSMSSPSSPSKDSKEEKADKEIPEKIQTGE